MHVFLKGPIQIGKSTILLSVIDQLVKEKKLIPGGFSTHSGLSGDFNLYISPFGEPPIYDKAHCAGYRSSQGAVGFPHTFDTAGVDLLHAAQKQNGIICMDELGFLEKEAFLFQRAVCDCLDGPIPVLGVLKAKRVPWHDAITSHPAVTIIDVNLRNRSTAANEILKLLDPYI
jgi:nucleoside-triphosphatase